MSFSPRLYLPAVPPDAKEIALDPMASHYLVKVLRLSEGTRFIGFDPQAFQYELTLEKQDPAQAVVKVHSRTAPSLKLQGQIALGQSLPKASKMDTILRQGTEVGVHRFIPLVTQRSVSRPDDSGKDHKNERWQKILVEACRQCGRNDVPRLDAVTDWKDGLDLFAEFDHVLLPYEKEAPTLNTVLESKGPAGKILILIGPEGGWSPDEVKEASDRGACPIHLPTPILRTETAGVVVVSMVRFFQSRSQEGIAR